MSNTSTVPRIVDVQTNDELRYGVNVTTTLSPILFGIIAAAYINGFITLYAFKFHFRAREGKEDVLDQIIIYSMLLMLVVSFVLQLAVAQWTMVDQFGQPAALGFGVETIAYALYICMGVAVNNVRPLSTAS